VSVVATTDRLVLRHLAPADIDALGVIQADPEVMRYVSGRPLSRDETAAQVDRIVAYQTALGFSLWSVVDHATDALLGRAGLLVQIIDGVPEVEVAYLLARASWGRGLGTEVAEAVVRHAREVVGLRRVVALVHPANVASARVVTKLGFAKEHRIEWHGNERDVWAASGSKG
jgi:RimJ/RimL family protein N-acetyltransferase